MATTSKKIVFSDSENGVKARQILLAMDEDQAYNTAPSYSADSSKYPDNMKPFIDKHMDYLTAHANLNAEHYISNLRLLTRLK